MVTVDTHQSADVTVVPVHRLSTVHHPWPDNMLNKVQKTQRKYGSQKMVWCLITALMPAHLDLSVRKSRFFFSCVDNWKPSRLHKTKHRI
jgi:hypothetical protein